MNLPPVIIDDRPQIDKRAHYILDMTPAAIYVASEKSVRTLTNPSDSPQILVLTYDDPNHRYSTKKD